MNQDLRDEYVHTLTTKLAETDSPGMVVVLMERIEHYLGSVNGTTPSVNRTPPAATSVVDAGPMPKATRKRSARRKRTAHWKRVARILRQTDDGMTLAGLADFLIGMEPPFWDDAPSQDKAKNRLSALFGGDFKVKFIRPDVFGGKWRAA